MLVADEVYHLLDWESGTTTTGDEEDDPSSDAKTDEFAPSRRPASIARFDAPGPHCRECGTTTTTAAGVDRDDDRGRGRIGCCVSVSSFTKIWGPGMRLGWIDAPEIVVRRLRGYGYVRSQGGHGVFAGGMMTRAIESRLLDAFLERLRREYAERYDLMCNILNEESRIVLPTRDYPGGRRGGYFLWIQFPSVVDSDVFLRYSVQNFGVKFMAGGRCDPFDEADPCGRSIRSCARLCFADLDREELGPATSSLLEAFRSFMLTIE